MRFNLGGNAWVEQSKNSLKLLTPTEETKGFPANFFTYHSVLFLPDQSSVTISKNFTQADFEQQKTKKK